MADSAHVTVVRRLYEARGNPDIIRQVLAPDIRWEVVEGFPYSGVYVGLDDVLRNFWSCRATVRVMNRVFSKPVWLLSMALSAGLP